MDLHDKEDRSLKNAVRVFLGTVLVLVCAGIVMLASASTVKSQTAFHDPYFLVERQLVWMVFGLFAMWFALRFDYRRWMGWGMPLAFATLGLLVLVLIIGPKIGGSRRWLRLSVVSFQPSELAKFSTVIMLAACLVRVPLRVHQFKEGLLIPGGWLGVVAFLVLCEPDFGTAVLIGAVGWILLLVGGAKKPWLFTAAVFAIAFLCVYVRFNHVRWMRFQSWLHPDLYPEGAYQYLESVKAFMLGGIKGSGLDESIQKHFYLPEVHTDFIFAIIGEELGVAGTLTILALFSVLLICGTIISTRAPDTFGRLLAFGITCTVTLQSVINICVVTGSLPTKGLPLPFFSYGGSNLLLSLFEVGVLLNVGRQALAEEADETLLAPRGRRQRPDRMTSG